MPFLSFLGRQTLKPIKTLVTSLFFFYITGIATSAFSQNISYSPLHTSSSFINRNVNVNLPVGSLPGTADVVSSGGSSYAIPVFSPPGTNGIAPSVSVSYNSQSGNGIMGMGWNISGLSSISRTPRNNYFDGQTNPVVMDNNDRFVLDGMRLILKSGGYGEANSTYGKEIEDFAEVVSKSTQGNGPEWFEVITKDGVRMEYGNTPDSRHTGQYATVLVWALNKIQYPNGNYITFSYNTNAAFQLLIDEINYTGNAAAGILPYNKIKFEYKLRTTDPNTTYENETRIENKFLLDKITSYAEGQISSSYQFNYGHNDISSFLNEVIMSGSDGTALNSTIFKYGDVPAPFQTSTTAPYSNPASTTITGDFNADGITDFLAARQESSVYRISVYTKNPEISPDPEGFNLAYQTDLPSSYSVVKRKDVLNAHTLFSYDFSGDGADDMIMTNISGTGASASLVNIRIYQSVQNYGWPGNGNPQISFSQLNSITPYPGYSKIHTSGNFLFIGDFNGDGAQDMLSMLGTSGGSFGSHLYFGNESTAFLTAGITGTSYFTTSDWASAHKVNILDFNGDGKSDLMIIKDGVCEIFTFDGYAARRIFFDPAHAVLQKNSLLHFGDFNGDKKTDILAKNTVTGAWKIMISNGKYFYENAFTFANTPNTNITSGDHLTVTDLNGDGISDICHGWDPTWSSNIFFDTYYGKGYSYDNSSVNFHLVTTSYPLNLGAPPPLIGDFNGDGKNDMVHYKNASTPMDFFYFRKEGKENLLEKVKNGFNQTTEWSYKKLTHDSDFYVRGTLELQPLNVLTPAMFAVSGLSVQNSANSSETIQYKYERAILHRGGKGFLGFLKLTASNTTQGISTVSSSSVNSTYFSPYSVFIDTYHIPSGSLMNRVNYSPDFVSNAPKRYWIKMSNISESDYFKGTTKHISNTWDNYGNITGSNTTLLGGSNTIETTSSSNVYTAFVTTVPNQVTSQTLTTIRNGEAAFSTTGTFDYNNLGQLISKTEFSGQPKSIQTTYEYFLSGNMKKTTVSPSGMTPRNMLIDYDSKGRFPLTNTNILGQTSSSTFDSRWGKTLTSTDIDGLTTSFQYDAFGNLKKTTLPEGYSIDQSTGWYIIGPSVWYSFTSHPGKPDVMVWYDIAGREVKKQVQPFSNPLDWTESVKEYNQKGNLIYSKGPYNSGESGVREFNYQYDDYNRLTRIYDDQNQEAGETLYTYSYTFGNLQTTSTQNGFNPSTSQVSSTTTDPTGKIISAADDGGVLTYTYYSHGGPKEIKNGSSILNSMTYDAYGQQTTLTDINAGTTSYTYDALSQLISQTNANNQTHTMFYDLAGNITSRVGPEGTTSYEFFTSGPGINQIKKITGFAGNLQEFTHDSFGNVTTLKETIDGTDYTSSYTYNTFGDLLTINYPSGFGLKYAYDANGYLTTIKNSSESTTLFDNIAMNGSGQITAYSTGNGKSSTRSYKYGFPLAYATNGIQNLEMTWNYATGAFTKRKDLVKNKEENFNYDNLNRLTGAIMTGQTGQTFTYSANGNISAKTDVGSYSYSSPKPNAVTQITNPVNTVSPLTQNISYNAFLQPSVVTENNFELNYTYGADYNRIKSVTKQNGTAINTRYYLSGFEKDITGASTRFIHYISSPAGLISIVVRENGVDTYNYVYIDHLGSILTLTNNSGTIIAEQNFDAWGRRRSPSSWTALPPTAPTGLPTWLYRGYTGHEQLDNFGLINMNGRMYDPVVGRVLSPDNYVQDALDTQDYNRYSYARNSPLVYNDPDGQAVHIAVAAAIGGVINLAGESIKGNVHSFKQGAVAFGMGAVAGALAAATGGASLTYTQFALQSAVSQIPGVNINLGSGFSMSLSPALMMGTQGYSLGANVGLEYSNGSFNIGLSSGLAYGNSNITGRTGWDTRIGGGAAFDSKYFYMSLSTMQYNSDITSQRTGTIGLGGGGFKVHYENDYHVGGLTDKLRLSDGGDRFRTAALMMSYGDVSLGFNLFTGDPQNSEGLRPFKNINDHNTYYDNTSDKYRLGALYLGYKHIRFGANSERIRHVIQNRFAHDILTGGNAKWFRVLNNNWGSYGYVGSFNPFSLW